MIDIGSPQREKLLQLQITCTDEQRITEITLRKFKKAGRGILGLEPMITAKNISPLG